MLRSILDLICKWVCCLNSLLAVHSGFVERSTCLISFLSDVKAIGRVCTGAFQCLEIDLMIKWKMFISLELNFLCDLAFKSGQRVGSFIAVNGNRLLALKIKRIIVEILI